MGETHSKSTPSASGTSSQESSDDASHSEDHDGHDHGEGHHGDMDMSAGALTAEQDGYTVALLSPSVPAAPEVNLEFTIFGPDGTPVTEFVEEMEKPMHVVVVRQDLTGYEHVHPTLGKDGLWSAMVPMAQDGTYRVVTDFIPKGGEHLSLGTDFVVGQPSSGAAVVEESRTAQVDEYQAELVGDTAHESKSALKVTLTRDGAPVTSVEPYLGTAAHFVLFNADNLGYVHLHPADEIGSDGTLTFTAPPLEHGMYKGFLQVNVGGSVKTFAFGFEGK